jgi:hypothetical protein
MQIVIEMPEDEFEAICIQVTSGHESSYGYIAIANGTPLPKGHGRLIDADALKMDTRVCGDRYLSKSSLFVANKVIEQADTIIEADREESEDKE